MEEPDKTAEIDALVAQKFQIIIALQIYKDPPDDESEWKRANEASFSAMLK
jgi:hypothetical protein